MAVTVQQKVAGLYSAVFNRAPDQAGLNFWVNEINANGSGSLVKAAEGFTQHPVFTEVYGSLTSTQFVEQLYLNVLGSAGDAKGIQFWVDKLASGASKGQVVAEFVDGSLSIDLAALLASGGLTQAEYDAALVRQQNLTNKVDVGLHFVERFGAATNLASTTFTGSKAGLEADPVYKASQAVLNGVTNVASTVATAKAAIDAAQAPTALVGQATTFTLTIGENRLTGTSGDDIFNAPALEQQGAAGSADSLEGFDILNGGAGNDTLNATVNGGVVVTPTLSNIENVTLRVTAANGAIDFGASTGVQSVTVQNSTAATGTIGNLGGIATIAVKNQNQNVSFDGSTAATLGLTLDTFGKNVDGVITANTINLGAVAAAKATTLNATLNNAYAVIDSTSADAINTLSIAATGTNQVSFVDSGNDIKSVTITGAGSVDLTPTALTGALATFNASAATGAIKADIQSTVLAAVTTGSGNDLIDMDTTVVAGSTVNLGAGNDTLQVGAVLGNFTSVNGGEGTDTINITDGATLTVANAKLISGFEVLDVSKGTGNYNVSLNNFATVQIDEAVNGALAAAVGFTNASDSFTLNVASKAKTGADFAVGAAITVTGKDYTGTTATGDAETFTLVANMRDGSKNDVANGNINANTITVAGVEHLVVESNVSTLDGGSKALGAANHTLTASFVAAEAETITVKGAASVDLSGVTTIGVVTKVDATQSTGNVKIDLSTHAKSVAYFGSEGIDTLSTGTKGDNIYTGKGADIVTLTTAGVRDTFVLKAATDSQIGDTDKSGKITLAGDESKAGVQQIDTITGFTAGGTATSDRLDVTNFAFAGAQRGVVDVSALVVGATDLTSIADLFAAPAGDRGLAFSVIASQTYVFIDANKDGNFTAADDAIIKLAGVATGLSEVDVNF